MPQQAQLTWLSHSKALTLTKMLQATTSGFDKPLFPELVQTIETLPQTLADEALAIAAQYEPIVQALIQYPPARGNDTYVWSRNKTLNDKARAWWFANLAEGNIPTDGRHYLRQGGLEKSLRIEVDIENEVVVIRIVNTYDKSRYVVGTLNARGADTRNPSHAKTGWPLIKPKVDEMSKRILVALVDNLIMRIGRI